jgi:T-complex protein 1 subunit gamma
MFNKDVTHAKMRRHIANPRVLLLDCPLEYRKGESATNVEVSVTATSVTVASVTVYAWCSSR